jgi:hypothetical protein
MRPDTKVPASQVANAQAQQQGHVLPSTTQSSDYLSRLIPGMTLLNQP